MSAVDTVLCAAVNPGAGPTAFTTALSGDSLVVRAFNDPATAMLDQIIRQGTTLGNISVRSPYMHDTTQGIQITPGETPSVYSLPGMSGQPLSTQDTLQVFGSGGAAETDIVALVNYYQDLGGVKARLASWSDIEGNYHLVKPLQVAVTSSATAGAWKDTSILTTETLLHANKDYAVLGYTSNAALGVIGLRGTETGNLRNCGPGSTSELVTTKYFMQNSIDNNVPGIPVFNAANAGNIQVSVAAATPSVVAIVELILVMLDNNLPNI